VAEHISLFHRGNDAVVDVKIGAANGARRHLDDGITRVLYLWIRHGLATHVAFAMPGQSLHLDFPFAILGEIAQTAARFGSNACSRFRSRYGTNLLSAVTRWRAGFRFVR
jgi:hypothetical protein